MAENLIIPENISKAEKYEALIPQIKALCNGESDLIANLANITAALVGNQWNGWGFSEGHWAFIMVFAGFLIASIVVRLKNNVFYGLAVIWALYGIMLKRGTEISEVSQQIEHIALYAMIALAAVVAWRFRAWLKY